MLSAFFIIPGQVKTQIAPSALLTQHMDKIRPDTILVSSSRPVSALCWYYKRNDVYMLDTGELDYGLDRADSRYRLLTFEQLNNFINRNYGKQGLILIVNISEYVKLRKLGLRPPIFEDSNPVLVFALF